MKNFTWILLILLVSLISESTAQRKPRSMNRGSQVTGSIRDSVTNNLVEYAYVLIFSQKDDEFIASDVSDKTGQFTLNRIRPGNYYITVQFMGYKSKRINDISVKPNAGKIEFGDILIAPDVLSLDNVEVVAENPSLTYKIDKKVINVEQLSTEISGTAVDVLENVPSITVDIEGNVALRGSSNFIVLIDNRPTILEANDLLQQMPASSIENIEIITNPSAKYDPDGNSGIINIVTKKGKRQNLNGLFNIKGGVDEKYGGDFLVNYTSNSAEYYIGGNYDNRHYPGTGTSLNKTFLKDTTSFINSQGSSSRGRESYGVRGGINLSLSDNDQINSGFRYGKFGRLGNSNYNYDEWTVPGNIHNLFLSDETSDRSGIYFTANLGYQHLFRKGHDINVQAIFSRRDMESTSINNLLDDFGIKTSGQETTESGPGQNITLKLDYTYSITDDSKIEAGYQSRLSDSEEENKVADYNRLILEYQFDPKFQHSIKNLRNIHSVYGMYSNLVGDFGMQFGFRGEYTDRSITLNETGEKFLVDRFDYFPTAHFSYSISEGEQFMASYTRRIHRPRGWNLEPFITWTDAYNVRRGNPDLIPEAIDSYEFGYHKYFGSNLFSAEVYYRVTHDVIERVRSVYDVNVTLRTSENVGKDYTFGSELALNVDPFAWWDINLMGNIYNYKIEGVLFNRAFSRESFNWNVRLNNSFNISNETRIQFNGNYNSPSVSSQGTREGYVSFNLALRRDFFNKALSATLQVRDVFQTVKRESTSEGANFFMENSRIRNSPIVMLNLRFNLNHSKQKRDRTNSEDIGDEGEEY